MTRRSPTIIMLFALVTVSATMAAPAARAVTQFVGDVDGFGIPAAGLTGANGTLADTDGDQIIEAGELLPDWNNNGSTAVGSGDTFDFRSAAELSASDGAQHTDYSVEGSGGVANGLQFIFNFTAPTSGPDFGADHFINFVFGDYDVFPATISIDGTTVTLTLQGGGQDGLVQSAFSEVPWADIQDGEVIITVNAPNEPYLAFDYALLDLNPFSDSDQDGIPDPADNCPCLANLSQADADGDGIGDACDSGPVVETACFDGIDNNSNGGADCLDVGCACLEACLPFDSDGDGAINSNDSNPVNSTVCSDQDFDLCDDCSLGSQDTNNDGLDTDGDGACDLGDADDDGDGFSDIEENNCASDPLDAASIPIDIDSDGICDVLDTCVDVDGDQIGNGTNANTGCVIATPDFDDSDANTCVDDDSDTCDDCSQDASFNPANDGPDLDGDGLCNAGDPDDDGDGWLDLHEAACGSNPNSAASEPPDADGDALCDSIDTCQDVDGDGVGDGSGGNIGCATSAITDSDDSDPTVCGDSEPDTCEDCSSGTWNSFSDGLNSDADELCNAGDPDDDNDGWSDVDEFACNTDPLDLIDEPDDSDNDGICDLLEGCLTGNIDGDALCDDFDTCVDFDLDGVGDGSNGNTGCLTPLDDSDTADPLVCADSENDGCEDCSSGSFDPADDGPDNDGDLICDSGDLDDDNDGLPDVDENSGDFDGDGIPDVLDPDSDGDGIADGIEGNGDSDGDGIPNHHDSDSDGDGIDDSIEGSSDGDGDGIPSFLDDDSDGDGVLDADSDPSTDSDGDGIPDFLDLDDSDGGTGDSDGDGISDYHD